MEQKNVSVGTVYTVGYASGAAAEMEIARMMQDTSVLLIDIRVRPQSRWWPHFNKKQLRVVWGARYSHEKKLGNDNYRDRSLPVVLHGPEPEQAIAGLVALLQHGYSLVLLCACKNYETCHRKVVVEMIQHEMEMKV